MLSKIRAFDLDCLIDLLFLKTDVLKTCFFVSFPCNVIILYDNLTQNFFKKKVHLEVGGMNDVPPTFYHNLKPNQTKMSPRRNTTKQQKVVHSKKTKEEWKADKEKLEETKLEDLEKFKAHTHKLVDALDTVSTKIKNILEYTKSSLLSVGTDSEEVKEVNMGCDLDLLYEEQSDIWYECMLDISKELVRPPKNM